MPCITPEGTLTSQGRAVLAALDAPTSLDDVAERTGLALYRVRSSIRELVEANLVVDSNGLYQSTTSGREKLAA